MSADLTSDDMGVMIDAVWEVCGRVSRLTPTQGIGPDNGRRMTFYSDAAPLYGHTLVLRKDTEGGFIPDKAGLFYWCAYLRPANGKYDDTIFAEPDLKSDEFREYASKGGIRGRRKRLLVDMVRRAGIIATARNMSGRL